jgi:hypothetical protein
LEVTTRRGLFSEALGLIPVLRDQSDGPDGDDDRQPRDRPYRTYQEAVAELRRRERAAESSPAPASAPLAQRSPPRSWREGADEVAARERRA